MHLLSCKPPGGTLERAPASSLRQPLAGESWEGYWGEDERYYTRCTSPDGRVEWFRIADAEPVVSRPRREADVLVFPGGGALPRLMVGRYRGQAMLVGTRQRRRRLEGRR